MLRVLFLSLCFIPSTLITVAAQTTVSPVQTFYPSVLQQSIPTCAQPCLQKALAASFPSACTAQGDIACLCSHYGSTGESLGEMAFSCVYRDCTRNEQSEASVYNICLGQNNAVLPTRTALTVVVGSASPAKTTSSTTTKSSSNPASSATSTLTSAATFRTQVSSSIQSVFVDSVLSTLPATSATPMASATSALPPPPPPAATAEGSQKLTPAQIAGLSVAAVAAFVAAIGLMALSVCLRRRREQKYQQLSDEKSQGRQEKNKSTRFSHYVPLEGLPQLPKQSPLILLPTVGRADQNAQSNGNPSHGRPAGWTSIRPVQRLGVGTSINSSNSSLPLDQIGLAISAEVDERLVAPPASKASTKERRPRSIEVQRDAPIRPFSTTTQNTVFEEDEVLAHRRSSTLLPTPPIPIAPIRRLQPSRSASKLNKVSSVPQTNVDRRYESRGSELFLDIPARRERPQPRHKATKVDISNGSPAPRRTPQIRIAPPMQTTSSSSTIHTRSTSTTTPVSGNGDDIPDYYFSPPIPRASPAQSVKPKVSPRTVQIKSKKSMSTVSSHTSTNLRDSFSSQTSFETADPNDPTPEDEEDKQLSSEDNKLSPVAELESPISRLRYPKIPRASNQRVPRSPRATSTKDTRSPPAMAPEHSALLVKRRGEKEALQLETQMHMLHHPQMNKLSVTDSSARYLPSQRRGHHIRSSSDSLASPTSPHAYTYAQRNTRTQSGLWPSNPIMYEPHVPSHIVKPLNVRRGVYVPEAGGLNIESSGGTVEGGLKSPEWVPRLTPTRKGDDLLISVGWGR